MVSRCRDRLKGNARCRELKHLPCIIDMGHTLRRFGVFGVNGGGETV